MRPVISLLVVAVVATRGHGQVKDVTVSGPTRIDWQFAAQGFGPKAGMVPDDYDSKKQKYQLLVPKDKKAPEKGWPLVLFISPGDGPAGLGNWQKVCEKEGVLFASPYKAGNNVAVGQRTRIVLDVLDDVRRQFRVDPEQTYLAGFSGGGRMACALGFALPEYIGGVVPVCGTNPISGPTYLRHRAQDRLSVAFVTGETDFNRKENEKYMAPYFKDLGVRNKLWVAPKVGHQIPGPDVMAEVYAWLKEDLKRRQADITARPGLAIASDESPSGADQAKHFVETAQGELKTPERIWRGVAILQGVTQRWPKTPSGKQALALLQEVTKDEKLVEAIAQQGAEDEQKSLIAQARGLERFGLFAKAMESWQLLAKNYGDSDVGKTARAEIERLEGVAKLPAGYLGVGLEGNVVDQLAPGGPAEKAGLKLGDVVVKLGDAKIAGSQDVLKVMQNAKPGTKLTMEIRRGQELMTVTITVGARPK